MGIERFVRDGVSYVTMTEEEFEDRMDILSARAAEAAGGEYMPHEVVKALIAGESPVRVYRKHRGLTMQALADKSGVVQSYISEIETGKKAGSLDAMKALATALGVSLDDLV